ncbi:MAG: hypothetical protein ABI405_12315, partial [Parafilimonas sp.]
MVARTAHQIKILAEKGMRLLATGTLPDKQPSYLNWKENDAKTAKYIASALNEKNALLAGDYRELLNAWMKHLPHPVSFQEYYRFTRQAQRDMSDGSRVTFSSGMATVV